MWADTLTQMSSQHPVHGWCSAPGEARPSGEVSLQVNNGEFWAMNTQGADRPDQWQQILSDTHLPWRVTIAQPRSEAVFDAWVRRWWVDDLALLDCECSPCSGVRARRQLADTDGAFVAVLITRIGAETVCQGDAEADLRPGDAVAWDSTKPARFTVWEPLAKRSLLIPWTALDEVSGRPWMTGGVKLNAAAPATRLLAAYLDTLLKTLPDLSPVAVSAARNATLELFLGALRADLDLPTTGTAQPALRAAMDRYIDRHLLDETVTPAAVASAHSVSIRTVNRIFRATGQTVSEVIRVRRLARAREELTNSDRPISTIAHRWGFSDTSHFSRSFKACYGSSPTDYRGAVRQDAGPCGAPVQRPVAHIQRLAADQRKAVTMAAQG
jgi:AraC family transcriptional regulator, positive regulator of tynA and feaB